MNSGPGQAGCTYLVLGDTDYPTNHVLRHVLSGEAVELVKPSQGTIGFLRSVRGYRQRIGRGAVVVVSYPAHRAAVCVRLATLGYGVAVISAPLVLLHDSRIADRREAERLSSRAALYRVADLVLSLVSTAVVADTPSHARMMSRRLRRTVTSIPIGSVAELVVPDLVGRATPAFTGELRCVHYGNGFPIQGLGTVLAAAAQLPASIKIEIIGRPGRPSDDESDIIFRDPMPVEQLLEWLAESHVVIGQFGMTPQQARVIPTKVYDALALGRPVVTGTNPELERLGSGGLRLIEPGNSSALVGALVSLRSQAAAGELESLGAQAHSTYLEQLSIAEVRTRWSELLRSVKHRPSWRARVKRRLKRRTGGSHVGD